MTTSHSPANPLASAVTPPTWTINELIAWTTQYFASQGIESPRLEAQILLAHVLNCSRIDLVARSHEVPRAEERARFREFIRRRVEHWPVAYLVGHREFYLLPFAVSPAVLIPRPDTETLVLAALDFLKGKPAPTVLDLGTGSGCIAVSIAHQCKAATITATDISPDALAIAEQNAQTHGVAPQIRFLIGDLFEPFTTSSVRYDLIVSNPPYIPRSELANLPAEVRDHEPRVALDGGQDGLVYYRRITAEAANFLVPGGMLLLEIGWNQNDAVREFIAEQKALELGPTIKDKAGRYRVVQARRR
jgi:release factor glutamine methyltransferase